MSRLEGPIPRAKLEGQRFGKLLVQSYAGNNKHSQSLWTTQCDCGITKVVSIASLRSGKVKSCGCLRVESWRSRPTKNILDGKFTCKGCHERLSVDSMHGGRTYLCVDCHKARSRARYAADPEKFRASSAAWRMRNPEKFREGVRNRKHRDPSRYLYTLARNRAAKKGIPFDLQPEDVRVPTLCPVLGITLRVGNPGKCGFPLPDSPTLDRIIPEKGYVRGNVVVMSWRANSLKKDGTLDEITRLARWMKEQYDGSTE